MSKNQSGLSFEELKKLRLEFTEDYLTEVHKKITDLEIKYKTSDQEGMQAIVNEIIEISIKFRAIINGPSDEDGVYIIRTDE